MKIPLFLGEIDENREIGLQIRVLFFTDFNIKGLSCHLGGNPPEPLLLRNCSRRSGYDPSRFFWVWKVNDRNLAVNRLYKDSDPSRFFWVWKVNDRNLAVNRLYKDSDPSRFFWVWKVNDQNLAANRLYKDSDPSRFFWVWKVNDRNLGGKPTVQR
jgi:hypothetical protein